jgi:hypothetical protein
VRYQNIVLGYLLKALTAPIIHFGKDETPPINPFWSITLYDREGCLVAHPWTASPPAAGCRSDTMQTTRSTLDLSFQNESPGPRQGSQLAAGAKGPFNPTMRLYAPKEDG